MLVYIFLFLIGLIVGSFLNVVIFRLPQGKTLGGRSVCQHCYRRLKWFDLLPVFSFLFLRGRCRFCQKKINWQYPLVELASAVLWIWPVLLFPEASWPQILFRVFLAEIFLVLAVTDLRFLLLPDKIIFAGAVGILFFGLLEKFWLACQPKFCFTKLGLAGSQWGIISLNHFLAAAVFFVVLSAVWLFSRGRALGWGDAKLMGLVGLVFGFQDAFLIFYTAALVGGIIGLALYLTKKADLRTKLPLGALISAVAIWLTFYQWPIDYFNFPLIFR